MRFPRVPERGSRALTRAPHRTVRGLLHLELEPGVISLLAGKPNPTTFPITSLSFKARNPLTAAEEDFTLTPAETSTALQYTFIAGVTTLVDWITKLQAFEHKQEVDPARWTVSIGSGGQDLLYKVRSCDGTAISTPLHCGNIDWLT